MVQRFIGALIGGLLTYLILWLTTITNPTDILPWYAAAAVSGAIASFLWPVLAGFWLGRRAQARRDAIQREVDRQIADQHRAE
ncbi:MAG TPA: hypothetical protein VLM76_07095 [Patescibacteria group bacterium]|nr:hypothetical protein [Patescibacteria group bacterium]